MGVSEGTYASAEDGKSYYSGGLTGCSMVFAIGPDGACVHHWKGSDFDQYVQTMQNAINAHIPSRTVDQFVIYSLERDAEEEGEKVQFAQQIATHFGAPVDLYLGGKKAPSNYDMSGVYTLRYENRDVTVVAGPSGVRKLPTIT